MVGTVVVVDGRKVVEVNGGGRVVADIVVGVTLVVTGGIADGPVAGLAVAALVRLLFTFMRPGLGVLLTPAGAAVTSFPHSILVMQNQNKNANNIKKGRCRENILVGPLTHV